MSCQCHKPSDFPSLSSASAPCSPCNQDTGSTSSEGAQLQTSWLDSVCHTTGLTILARVGDRLARFAGSGFIKLENGVASVVTSVPLRAVTLWHRLVKNTPASPPSIGEPLSFPYQVVADPDTNLHAIKGVSDQDSLTLWRSSEQAFSQVPVSEVPVTVKGPLLRGSNIELIGFQPIAANAPVTTVRPQKALSGKGIVILTEQDTVDSECACAPGTGTASTASTLALPDPEGAETYTLKFSAAQGLYWSED